MASNKKHTIRYILQQLVDGRLTIDQAEDALHKKVRRTAFYEGRKILNDSFQEIFNSAIRRMNTDEDTLRAKFYPGGGFSLDVSSDGDGNAGDGHTP